VTLDSAGVVTSFGKVKTFLAMKPKSITTFRGKNKQRKGSNLMLEQMTNKK
jgi:hypothetical protein